MQSLLIALLLLSCDKREDCIQNLTVDDYYEIPLLYTLSLFTIDESDHYAISIEDTNIILSKYKNGQVYVEGIKKGDTKLTLLDEVSNRMANTTIKVVDTYFAFRLNKPTCPFSENDEYVFFVKKDSTNFYTYNKTNNKITNKGHFSIEYNEQQSDFLLTLYFESSKDSLFDYKFHIRGVPNELLHFLIADEESQTNISTSLAQERPTRSNQPTYFEITNLETGLKQTLWLDFINFPYHIL